MSDELTRLYAQITELQEQSNRQLEQLRQYRAKRDEPFALHRLFLALADAHRVGLQALEHAPMLSGWWLSESLRS